MPPKESPSPKYLNQGQTGCVFRPALKCRGEAQDLDRSKVSKLFIDEGDAEHEWRQINVVSEMDPDNRFSLKSYGRCRVNRDDIPSAQLNKCGWDYRKQRSFIQHIYDYGGPDLQHLKNATLREFIQDARPLFLAALALKERGLSHTDIRPANVLYHPATKKMVLNDFGEMMKYEAILDKEFDMEYATFVPPEYGVYQAVRYDNLAFHAEDLARHYARALNTCLVGEDHPVLTDAFKADFGVSLDRFFVSKRLPEIEAVHTRLVDAWKKDSDGTHLEQMMVDLADRIDVYSLGFVLFDAMTRLYDLYRMNGIQVSKRALGEYVKLCYDMTCLNPVQRVTIEEAYERYQQIASKLKSRMSPTTMLVSARELELGKKPQEASQLKGKTSKLLQKNLESIRSRFPTFQEYEAFLKDHYVKPSVIQELNEKQSQMELAHLEKIAQRLPEDLLPDLKALLKKKSSGGKRYLQKDDRISKRKAASKSKAKGPA